MRARGMEIGAASSPGPDLDRFGGTECIPVYPVEMPRRITPFGDLRALAALRRVVRRFRPDIVHAHTPKGGLLGMLAATICGVPVRVYHMRGLPMMTARGLRRRLLSTTEWIACRLAHRVLCVSHSIRDVAIAEGLCAPDKITVLLGGSGNGVDAADRFNPDHLEDDARLATRRRLGIPEEALVIGFVGRLVREKGTVELTRAWHRLRESFPSAHLLLVGPFESRDPVPAATEQSLRSDTRVHLVGMDWNTPPLYAAMDVVALPTYREGFPNVPLEAAAMRLPVVATRIPGCIDAVADGESGTLVPVGDASALADALAAYLSDASLRRRHGEAGRARVCRDFQQERLWASLFAEYERLLATRTAAAPARIRAMLDSWVKRLLDVAIASAGLVALSPVLAVLAVLVRADLGGDVLFRQRRPGRHGRPFTLYKFRTMRVAASPGASLDDEDRLTSLGRLLRASSLDELPELWNVLRGDMSIVGPRPLLMEYMPLYSADQARRHEVRPGITGWAQVHGRNTVAWADRFALDVWYVDNRSLLLDLRIMARTVATVLSRDGISEPGHATMRRFRGSAG